MMSAGWNGEDLAGVCDQLNFIGSKLAEVSDTLEAITSLGFPHVTVAHMDSYGNGPVVQFLDEPGQLLTHYRGAVVQIIGWVIDTDGDTWPVVRSEENARPTVIRDLDRFDEDLDP